MKVLAPLKFGYKKVIFISLFKIDVITYWCLEPPSCWITPDLYIIPRVPRQDNFGLDIDIVSIRNII